MPAPSPPDDAIGRDDLGPPLSPGRRLNPARRRLAERWVGYAGACAVMRARLTRRDVEECLSDCYLGLVIAASRTDGGKSETFARYAGLYMRNEAEETWRSEIPQGYRYGRADGSRTPRVVRMSGGAGLVDPLPGPAETVEADDELRALAGWLASLPAEEGWVIRQRYGLGDPDGRGRGEAKTYSEIARLRGRSAGACGRDWVSKVERRALEMLREMAEAG